MSPLVCHVISLTAKPFYAVCAVPTHTDVGSLTISNKLLQMHQLLIVATAKLNINIFNNFANSLLKCKITTLTANVVKR